MKFWLILPLENSLTISEIYNLFTFECFFNDFLWKENLLDLLTEKRWSVTSSGLALPACVKRITSVATALSKPAR